MSDDPKAIVGEIISKDAPEPVLREAEEIRFDGYVAAWRDRLELWSDTKVAESVQRFEAAAAAAEEAREDRLTALLGTKIANERLTTLLPSILEEVGETITAKLTEAKVRRLKAEYELNRFKTKTEIRDLKDNVKKKELNEKLTPKEEKKTPPRKPKRTYRDKVDDMLDYGVMGINEATAEEAIQAYIEKRGGKEKLTPEDHKNILKARQDAKRRDGGGF